jgi:hypothetical protein
LIVILLSALSAASIPTSTTSNCPLELRARSMELALDAGTISASEAVLRCRAATLDGAASPRLDARSLIWERGRFRLVDARFTTCRVPEAGAPDWEIRLGRAVVDPDRGARGRDVAFAIRGVPVLALPAASMPLGRRRSGLLAPDLDGSAIFGLRARQPVYWAIGRSWDATIDPGLSTRRGPEAAFELRGAPAARTAFELQPRLHLDFGAPRARGFAWARSSPLVRWAVDGSAFAGGPSAGVRVGAELALRGDPAWVAERGPTFQARAAEYARSRITVASTGGAGLFGAGLHLLQDLRASTYAAVTDDLRATSTFSAARPGPGETRYRLVEARWDLLPRRIGFGAGATLDVATRLHAFGTTAGGAGQLVRLDTRPELRWPIALPGRVAFEPWVAARVTGWWGEAPDDAAGARIALVAGGRLDVELDRTLGRYLLRLNPGVEGVVIPEVWARLPGEPLFVGDEVDLLGAVAQAALRVESSLFDLARGERVAGLSLSVGHDFGVAGRPGRGTLEATGRVDHRWRAPGRRLQVESELEGVWSFATSELREITVGSGLRHRRGHALRVAYRRVAERPAASSFIAPEELVPSATLDADGFVPVRPYLAGTDGSRVFVRPVSSADVVVWSAELRPWRPLSWEAEVAVAVEPRAAVTAVYGPRASAVQGFATRLRWTAPCGCWSASVELGRARDRPGWDVGARVELRGLGSIEPR